MEQRLIDANVFKENVVKYSHQSLKTIGLALDETPTVDAVPVVFINDPFHVVYQAFKELYPDKECEILFDYNVETTDTHERVKGVTIFPDDGSIPQIRIDCEQILMRDAADALEAAEKRIEELEAKIPKEGEWIVDKKGYPQIICSLCDVHIPMVAGWCMDAHINYCPNCGARM